MIRYFRTARSCQTEERLKAPFRGRIATGMRSISSSRLPASKARTRRIISSRRMNSAPFVMG